RGNARAVADTARRLARLRGLGQLAGIGAKACRGIGLGGRHVGRVRAGEAVAQQHLHHAHAVDHRNGRLEAALAAALQRGLCRLQRRLRSEDLHGESGVGGMRRTDREAEQQRHPIHFFLMKKMNSLFASACETSSWPVWREKVWKSLTAPGSVATTFSTWPEARSVSAFLVRRIGSGQLSPRVSSSLSKFMKLLCRT